jgi:pyrroline-5-carboxylate reductase
MTIGVIGLGRLGSALVRGLYRSGQMDTIYGYNRNPEKGRTLEKQYAGFAVCDSAADLLNKSDIVFLWTNGTDAQDILESNAWIISARSPMLISCTPKVPLANFTPRWAESLPNVNMPTGKGVTLIHFAPALSLADRTRVRDILLRVGSVYEKPADEMAMYSALCSCGPALYAAMMEILADTVADHHGYDQVLCRRLVRETMQGTLLLQELDGVTADEVVYRVAHPGGASEAGTRYLTSKLPGFFEDMLKAMNKW